MSRFIIVMVMFFISAFAMGLSAFRADGSDRVLYVAGVLCFVIAAGAFVINNKGRR